MTAQPGKSRNARLLIPLIAALSFVAGYMAGGLSGPFFAVRQVAGGEAQPAKDALWRLNEVLGYLTAHAINPLSADSLASEAIHHWMRGLDPYSAYLSPKERRAAEDRLTGTYFGLGLGYELRRDSMVVISLTQGGPAEIAGIHEGDRLLAAGPVGSTLKDMIAPAVKQVLTERMDSIWRLRLFRPIGRQILELTCTATRLPLPGIGPALLLEPGLAYLRIREFSELTDRQFLSAMDSLFATGSQEKDLILDLRDNPGGLLESSIKIINQLIPEAGKVMLTTVSGRGKRTVFKTSGRSFFRIRRLVVLVNEKTASAAEILAGALKDLDRGTLIGRPTFGKGLIQHAFPLSDGGLLKLSTSRCYTPSGRQIQLPLTGEQSGTAQGRIHPNIAVPLSSWDTFPAWQDARLLLSGFARTNKPVGAARQAALRAMRTGAEHPLLEDFLRQCGLPLASSQFVGKQLALACAQNWLGGSEALKMALEEDPIMRAARLFLSEKSTTE